MLSSLIFPLLFGYMAGWGELHTEEKTVHHSEHDVVACSCVAFVRVYRPDIPLIDAVHIMPATTTPSVGAVAKMVYPSGAHHVAYVVEVGDDTITVVDANYKDCEITRRTVTPPYRVVGYL